MPRLRPGTWERQGWGSEAQTPFCNYWPEACGRADQAKCTSRCNLTSQQQNLLSIHRSRSRAARAARGSALRRKHATCIRLTYQCSSSSHRPLSTVAEGLASCSRPASSYNLYISKLGLRIAFLPSPEGWPLSHVKVQRTDLKSNLKTKRSKVSGGVGGTLASGAPRTEEQGWQTCLEMATGGTDPLLCAQLGPPPATLTDWVHAQSGMSVGSLCLGTGRAQSCAGSRSDDKILELK